MTDDVSKCRIKISQGHNRAGNSTSLKYSWPGNHQRHSDATFPQFGFLASQFPAFLIRPQIISNIGTVITCENDERVLNEFMPRPPRIVCRFQLFKQLAKGNVILKHHVFAIIRNRPI